MNDQLRNFIKTTYKVQLKRMLALLFKIVKQLFLKRRKVWTPPYISGKGI